MVGVNHLSIPSFMDCQTASCELKMSVRMSLSVLPFHSLYCLMVGLVVSDGVLAAND